MKHIIALIFLFSFGNAEAQADLDGLGTMSLRLEAELTCEATGTWATYKNIAGLKIYSDRFLAPLEMRLNDSSLQFKFEIIEGNLFIKIPSGEFFEIGKHSYGENYCNRNDGPKYLGKNEVFIELKPEFQFLIDQKMLEKSCANRKKTGFTDLFISQHISATASKLGLVNIGQSCKKLVRQSGENSVSNKFFLKALYFVLSGIGG